MPEVRDALAQFQKGEFEAAMKLLKDAAKKNPDRPPPHLSMADWFMAARGTYASVRNELEQAVIDRPDDPEPYLVLGTIAMNERRIPRPRCRSRRPASCC